MISSSSGCETYVAIASASVVLLSFEATLYFFVRYYHSDMLRTKIQLFILCTPRKRSKVYDLFRRLTII